MAELPPQLHAKPVNAQYMRAVFSLFLLWAHMAPSLLYFFSRTLPGCAAGPPCPPRLPAQMVSGYKDQVQPSLPRPLLLSPPPGQPRSGDELPGGSNISTILCAYCLARVGLHWRLNSNQASFCGWPRDKVTVAWDFRFSKSDMVRTSGISSTSKIKIISPPRQQTDLYWTVPNTFFCFRSG